MKIRNSYKIYSIFILGFVFVCLISLVSGSTVASAKGSTKTITRNDNGKIPTFQVGDKVEIVLPATYSTDLGPDGIPIVTGSKWVEKGDGNGHLPSFHSKVIKPVAMKVPTPEDNNQVFIYEVIGKGKIDISFNYRDSKNKDLIQDTFITSIVVE